MSGASAALALAGRLLRAGILVSFLVATAYGTFFHPLHFSDVLLPVAVIATLATAPGWVLLGLAARARGAPWGWLAFAAAWGAFAAAWMAMAGEALLEPMSADIGRAAEVFGRTVADAAPVAVIAPLVEEPAKLLGVWIAFAAARRSGAVASVALGAAIGGLVGLAFGVAEVAHHTGVFVSEVGAVDVSGVFVIDWRLVELVAEQEIAHKFVLAGLTNHALFSALAGAGLALLVLRRRRLAVVCFVTALGAHVLVNSVGSPITEFLVKALAAGPGPLPPVPLLLTFWLAGLGAFVVAEGWAAVLLVRFLRREERRPATHGVAVP
jgi:RsiW-degrading membrane proteinase PrsW (M82 family)